jgi:phage terminase small subunit
VWQAIVGTTDPDHFQASDAPLIAEYCRAVAMAEQAGNELARHGAVINGKVSCFITVQEKAHRSMVALAHRLRLSPQSRQDKGRQTAKGPRASIYEGMSND